MSEKFRPYKSEDSDIIKQEKNKPEKTFLIHKEKTFKITKIETPSFEWFRQRNLNDCGPCFLLNALNVLGTPNLPQSIEDVRTSVNEKRQKSGRGVLQREGWFSTGDIDQYLRDRGFKVKGYVADPRAQEDTRRNVLKDIENHFDLIYTTFPGLHYRGVAVRGDQNLLLDSFNDGPQPITREQCMDIVINTLRAQPRSSGQWEHLGIVRK